MANANSQFGGFLTNVGVAKQTNANALQIPWKITRMQLGDGGGEPTQAPDPVPRPDQTALIRVVHDAPLNALYPSPDDPGVLIAELVLPPNIGGFWIRETALRDADGDLIAVAAPAPSYKPQLNQGSGRTQTIRMHVVFGNTANVQLKIDPSIVLATREYVDRRDSERQPLNARLTTLAQQVMAANQLIYSTGPDEFGMTAFPTFARELIAADTSAKARAKLELRSAALLDATTSVTDRTVGRAVRMGDLGFGQMTGPVNEVDFNNLPTQYPYSGRLPNLYGGVTAKNSPKAGEFFWYLHQHLRTASDGTTSVLQVAFPYRATVDGFWFRSRYQNTWSTWEEIKSARQLAEIYAPLASPAFTGTPTAPTAPAGTNSAQIATTAFVRAAIAALVGSSPAALDTLNELAAALGNDPNFATTMTNALAGKLGKTETAAKAAALASSIIINGVPVNAGSNVSISADATAASVLAAMAAAGIGGVGTYAFAIRTAGTTAPGATVPGSVLQYSSTSESGSNTPLPGTWRAMGYGLEFDATLYLRIA